MRSLNEVRISGTIPRDADVKHFDSGARVANFSLTVDRTQRANDFPEFKAWDEVADAIKEHGKPGRIIFVDGRLQTDLFPDKNAPAPTNGDKQKMRKATYVVAKHVRIVDEKSGQTIIEVEATKRDENQQAEPDAEPAVV